MSTSYDLPYPGEPFAGSTVVASAWGNDSVPEIPVWGTLLLLNPTAPFYTVAEIVWSDGSWASEVTTDFFNIVPAAREYNEQSGCW